MEKRNNIEKEFKYSNEIQGRIQEEFMKAVNAYDKASENNESFPQKTKEKINSELKESEKEILLIRKRFNTAYTSHKSVLKSTDEKEKAFNDQNQKNFNAEVLSLEKDLDVLYEKYTHKFHKICVEIQNYLITFAKNKETQTNLIKSTQNKERLN